MTRTDLVDLAREQRLEELEAAWHASLDEPGSVDPYCKALQALCERDMASRALALANTMLDRLAQRERIEDAFQLGMTLVERDAHNDSLTRRLFGLVEQRYRSESWFAVIAEVSGLRREPLNAVALGSFERMRRFTVGHVVYHRAGWGEGVVTAFDVDRRELSIRFADGREQEIALTAAVDSMVPLAEDDFRAMLLTQRQELDRLADEEPAMLIRKVAKIYRGRVSSTELKTTLSPALVATKKWASFWKMAKAAAATDPYLQVEGSSTRPSFVLRSKPLSFGDEMIHRLRHCDHLGEEVEMIREFLERTPDPAAQDTILGIAEERIDAAARSGRAKHAHVLDGLLLLQEHNRHPSASAASELKAMLTDEGGAFAPENFSLLATQDARDHAVCLLPEALGESWADLCRSHLTRFPPNTAESVVQLLQDRGLAKPLISLWDQVAPYPQRYPMTTYLLGRLYADGEFEGVEGAPPSFVVARVLLHLSRVLTAKRKGDATSARLWTRVTGLLTGRRAFLAHVFENIDRDNLAAFLGICERGGEDFPQEIVDMVLRTVSRLYPDLTAKPERPFWEEGDSIYVSRAGLALKREEHRRLVEELIPANSAAIGAAASLGDLSENSEWESAMEEQRNLTTRAAMADSDLRRAKLLEEQVIPDSIVAPGTRVTITVLDTGEQRAVRLMGPWDGGPADVVNYLAPFAQPLLGKAVGDTARLPSEHGEQQVRVDAIERLF